MTLLFITPLITLKDKTKKLVLYFLKNIYLIHPFLYTYSTFEDCDFINKKYDFKLNSTKLIV
jgi:hypothetical protein